MYLYTHLEDYIYNLYKSIGITNPFDLDMLLIAKKLGVEIVYEKRRIFYLDDEINLVRGTKRQEWMDFGHEIGHYLRHAGNTFIIHPLFRELQEWQADSFSLHFCIPTFMLEKMTLPRNKSEAIGKIALTFGVEYEFAEIRLEKWLMQKERQAVYSRMIGF